MDIYKEKPKQKSNDFFYTLKLRTALIGFVLYLILSGKTAFRVLNLIISSIVNNVEIINEQKEVTLLARIIMAFIIAIILFIF
jgi:hypothetical protein